MQKHSIFLKTALILNVLITSSFAVTISDSTNTIQRNDLETFFSYSKSSRKNSAITVISGYDVIYDDSEYQRISVSQKIYKDYDLGVSLELDETGQDILSYSAMLTTDKRIYLIEQSKLSGKITDCATFEDNRYLDIKVLSRPFRRGTDKGLSTGFQYLSYERPSAYRSAGINYYDTKLKTQFIGFVMEFDGVKSNLLYKKITSGNDWYFYNTTALGLGHMSVSSQNRIIGSNALATPSTDSWTGFGINGEYEVGYVRYQKINGYNFAFKAGYFVSLEGPVMFQNLDVAYDHANVDPTEQLMTYGVNFSLLTAF